MDTLRLLSRGTKPRIAQKSAQQHHSIPSSESSKPQLFSETRPKKRRRTDSPSSEQDDNSTAIQSTINALDEPKILVDGRDATASNFRQLSERKSLLKQHKIKIAWLRIPKQRKKSKRSQIAPVKRTKTPLFPDPLLDFTQLESRVGIPSWIANNVRSQGYREATEVQMAAIPLLSNLEDTRIAEEETDKLAQSGTWPNLLTVAPTGSGKTLAFLIPTLTGIAALRKQSEDKQKTTRALILAPTKELVGQIVNEGRTLVQNTGFRVSAYKKDMRLQGGAGDDDANEDLRTVAKADILVSTPGNLHSAVKDAEPGMLADVQYLILDEADVLLDPLFREQTVGIWKSLTNPLLRVSLWSATMGSNIEDLTSSIIEQRLVTIQQPSETPFIRLVVGLKDSAVPNVQHRLIYAATEQGKLMGLRQLLHPATSSTDSSPVLRPPFIVFTQTIERAIALHSELLYDIPVEAGGISRIAVLHSNLSDKARDAIMTRFRKGEVWVLITTDLLSRGIDFRGVNGVVNYDIPSSSAAYIHRTGRTGRAGREGGIAVTLYSKEDITYLKHIANVIAIAQKQGTNNDDTGIQQWLLDALPSLSKNDKQKFKKHGIEARTSKGMSANPKAARKARISTKPGYLRREENNRTGAIEGNRRRAAQTEDDADHEEDLTGFG